MGLFGSSDGEPLESKEYWLLKVKEDWIALRYVEEQTPELCMAGVQRG